MVSAAVAQRLLSTGTVQGNPRMTIGFEHLSAIGASSSLGIDELMAVGTIRHDIRELHLGLYPAS